MIKDQLGEMLTDQIQIKERWREYFSNLLNVENAREQLGEVPAVEGLGWQIGMESKGIKVNTGKIEVIISSRRGTKTNIKDS